MIQPLITLENIKFIKQDKNRNSSFFKRSRIYPHLPPRYWSQYGKCFYFNLVLGFHFVENLFAGVSKLNAVQRKGLNLFRMPLSNSKYRLTLFEFFWLFYNFIFSIVYLCILNICIFLNFLCFKINFNKYFNFTEKKLYFFFQRFFFLVIYIFINFLFNS